MYKYFFGFALFCSFSVFIIFVRFGLCTEQDYHGPNEPWMLDFPVTETISQVTSFKILPKSNYDKQNTIK